MELTNVAAQMRGQDPQTALTILVNGIAAVFEGVKYDPGRVQATCNELTATGPSLVAQALKDYVVGTKVETVVPQATGQEGAKVETVIATESQRVSDWESGKVTGAAKVNPAKVKSGAAPKG